MLQNRNAPGNQYTPRDRARERARVTRSIVDYSGRRGRWRRCLRRGARAAQITVELAPHRLGRGLESGLLFCGNRVCRGQAHRARIAVRTVDAVLVVQVRSSREAAATDVADDVALIHARAGTRAAEAR